LALAAFDIARRRTPELRTVARSRRLLDLVADASRGVLWRLVDGLPDGAARQQCSRGRGDEKCPLHGHSSVLQWTEGNSAHRQAFHLSKTYKIIVVSNGTEYSMTMFL
jgi:hypothetical protein